MEGNSSIPNPTSTLLFRHLPRDLSEDERKDLLHHLGAAQVKVFGQHGPMKNTAFATFKSEAQANEILLQLHQVEFLGSRLVVEFAHCTDKTPSKVDQDGVSVASLTRDEEADSELTPSQRRQRDGKEIKFDTTFNTWGVKHPRRPELCYQYPPPTPSVLTNILHTLAAVPKFYVQVLHLMNKMDLPAPFGMVTPAPPVHPDLHDIALPDNVAHTEMDISSSAESELESDGEGHRPPAQAKRSALQRSQSKRHPPTKRPRLSELQDTPDPPPSSITNVPVSEIFEIRQDSAVAAKKIALKLPSSMTTPTSVPPSVHPPMWHPPPLPSLPPLPPQPIPPEPQQKLPPNIPLLPSQTLSAEQNDPSQGQRPEVDSLYDPSSPLPVTDFALSKDSESQGSIPPSRSKPDPTEELYGPHPADKIPPAETHDKLTSHSGPDSRKADEPTTDAPSVAETEGGGGFGLLQPVSKVRDSSGSEEDNDEREWGDGKFVSSSQLRRERLSKSEMKDLSVFRRYAEGQPSCRLYIKNLAKQITEEDLHWVYGRYVDWSQEVESNIFDIRVMREGRMKGQAFVTLPSEKMATRAVRDTNGFLLKDKPMVVQFARSAKAEEDKAAITKDTE